MIRQLRKVKDLRHLTIHAVDGEIGKPELALLSTYQTL